MLAPLVVFAYNRPEHIKKTIDAITKNHLADETEVYIYSDAAKNEESIEKVKLVREYLDSLLETTLFKSLKIIKSKTNKGLANSVINGVNETFKKYRKVIVLEDDLVSSLDFLQYMNSGLDYYEKNSKIWSISGYTFNIDIPKDYKSEIYLSYRGCSWGWATWKDRWEKIDWDVSDYYEFKTNKALRKKFNCGGRDMSDMLDSQMQRKIDSWAIRWCYSQSKQEMLTVYPVVSRIKNIGFDGTGTHSGWIISNYDVTLNNSNRKYKFDNPSLDSRILKAFKDKFMSQSHYIEFKIKSIIKRAIRMLK